MKCAHLHPHMQGPIYGRCNEHSLLSLAATPFSFPTIADAPSVDKPDYLLMFRSQSDSCFTTTDLMVSALAEVELSKMSFIAGKSIFTS